jgi:hypothetical protein
MQDTEPSSPAARFCAVYEEVVAARHHEEARVDRENRVRVGGGNRHDD